jgi:hypothetical protein
MPNRQQIDDLIKRYRDGAEGTGSSEASLSNSFQKSMHACYKQLRETAEGQSAIMSLMSDPSPYVRCWASVHSLQWNMPAARNVLELIRDSKGPASFDAEMTLEELEKGRLDISFDY